VILEEMESAKKRGARIYCELVGYGMSGDAYHIAAPSEDGDGPRASCATARGRRHHAREDRLHQRHGTSTPLGDKAETLAIKRVFGGAREEAGSVFHEVDDGHLLGAAGGLETGICALAMHHGVLPPTINYDNPDPECDLDYVPNTARPARVEYVLSNSFGFGGTNGCLIMKRMRADLA